MGLFGGNKHKMTAEEIRKQRAKENEIFDNKDGKTNDVKVNDQGRIEYIHTPPEDTKEIMWERKQERFLQSRYEELKKNGPSYSTRYYRKKLDDKAEETMTSYPTVMTHTLELKKIFDDINFETYQSFTDKMSLVEWDLYIEELAKEFEKIRFPYTTERQYFNDLSDFGYEKFFEKLGMPLKRYYFCYFKGYSLSNGDLSCDNEYSIYYAPNPNFAKLLFQNAHGKTYESKLACSKMFTEEEWIAEDMENRWTGAEHGPSAVSGFLPFGLSRNAGKPYRSPLNEINTEKDDVDKTI